MPTWTVGWRGIGALQSDSAQNDYVYMKQESESVVILICLVKKDVTSFILKCELWIRVTRFVHDEHNRTYNRKLSRMNGNSATSKIQTE